MATLTVQCYQCKTELNVANDFGRQDTCIQCRFDTRVCLNCVYYDPQKYNECSEPVADRIVNKTKSNFCDYFKPGANGLKQLSAKEQALKAAEALFKKK